MFGFDNNLKHHGLTIPIPSQAMKFQIVIKFEHLIMIETY